MGVLTDFVIADLDDARRVCDSDCPSEDFDGLDGKGIDLVMLGTLHSILSGRPYDLSELSECICERGEDGPWVFEVPPDLVRRLSALGPPAVAEAGQAWSATEEFSLAAWEASDVLEALRDLVSLCQRAIRDRKSVLVWMWV